MSSPCAIWNAQTFDSGHVHSRDAYFYDSPRAGGPYSISRRAKSNVVHLTDRQKACLTTWLMDQRRAGSVEPFITDAEVTRAKTSAPKNLPDRRDNLLRAVAVHTPELGESMAYYDFMGGMVDGDKGNSFWAHKDYLFAATESVKIGEVEKLIDFASEQGFIIKSHGKLSLTFDGHAHLENLNSSNTDSVQAFVAMWFGPDVADAYDLGIAPAVFDAGYKPLRIDRKEHNNKIDDEIIAEIRRSRFVVADFTCGLVVADGTQTAIPRGGVYYEAGFAQGLGIPVIWCCREDHIGHVHFDTRQFNHITWASPEDLKEKLRNRIGAVLGDGPGVAMPESQNV